MSGGYFDYSHYKIADHLRAVARDEEAAKRWPLLCRFLGEMADLTFDVLQDVDDDLSGDSKIKGSEIKGMLLTADAAFELRFLRSVRAAAERLVALTCP